MTDAAESDTMPWMRRIAESSSGSLNSCARTCPLAARVNSVGLRDSSCSAYSAMIEANWRGIAPDSRRMRAPRHAAGDVDPLVADLHEDPTRVILALCRDLLRAGHRRARVGDRRRDLGPRALPAHRRSNGAQVIHVAGLPEDYTGIDLDYVAENLRALIAQQDRA